METLEDKLAEVNRKLSKVMSSTGFTHLDIVAANKEYEFAIQRKAAEDMAKLYLAKEYHYMVEDIKDLGSFIEWLAAGMHPKDYWIIEEYNFPVELAIMLKRK